MSVILASRALKPNRPSPPPRSRGGSVAGLRIGSASWWQRRGAADRIRLDKQAIAATISLLNARGERVETIKLGEMPEEGKATIMDRVEREVRAILKRRPDLKTEVVIDGAPDLRAHLLERSPMPYTSPTSCTSSSTLLRRSA